MNGDITTLKDVKKELVLSKQMMTKKFNVEVHPLLSNYTTMFDIEHLKTCNCCDDILFSVIRDEINKQQDIQKNKNYPNSENNIPELIVQKEKKSKVTDEIYRKALVYINTNIKDMNLKICPYIYKELLGTVRMFEKDYDLRKAKIQLVVKSILNYQFSLLSSMRYTSSFGFINRGCDRFGNVVDKINENEYYKIRLNEKIIQAVKVLDEMVEGNKNVNLNLNANSLSIEDVFSKLHNEIKDEYEIIKEDCE